MLLSGLDSFSQSLIFGYLGAHLIVRLWLTGDAHLRLKMRQSVREFVLTTDFVSPTPLNFLLSTFASISDVYSSFSIEEGEADSFYCPGEVRWELFPRRLRSVNVPHYMPLTQAQLCLFPTLMSLTARVPYPALTGLELPSTITHLELRIFRTPEPAPADLLPLIRQLPLGVRHLSISGASVECNADDAPLDFRHLPLEYFSIPTVECRSVTPTLWGMLPPSLTYISTTLYDLEDQMEPSPRSLSKHFPRLVHLSTRMFPKHVADNITPWDDLPATLISMSSTRPERSKSARSIRAADRLAARSRNFLVDKLSLLCPAQITSPSPSNKFAKLSVFTGMDTLRVIDYTEEQWRKDGAEFAALHASSDSSSLASSSSDLYAHLEQFKHANDASSSSQGLQHETTPKPYWLLEPLQRFACLQTLSFPAFLSATELRCLPKTLTSLKMGVKLTRTGGTLNLLSPLDHDAWPPLLRAFSLRIDYDPREALDSDRHILDLAIFPPRLDSLTLELFSAVDHVLTSERQHYELALEDHHTRFPFIMGDLLHLTKLQKLHIFAESYGKEATRFDRLPLFTSPLQLPTSLTSLKTSRPLGFSSSVIWDGWDEVSGTHRFDKLLELDLGAEYSNVLGAQIRVQRYLKLPKDEFGEPLKVGAEGEGEDGDIPLWLRPSPVDLNNPLVINSGIDTRIIPRLPRTLTDLRIHCNPLREPWSDSLVQALPRNLRTLDLYAGSAIPFEGNTASCLQYLPPKLLNFRFQAAADSYTITATPSDHMDFIPGGLPFYDIEHDYSYKRYTEYCRKQHAARYEAYLHSKDPSPLLLVQRDLVQ